MANLKFDFSERSIFHNSEESKANSKNYVYRDINTSGISLKKDSIYGKKYVLVDNRQDSNYDLDAVKTALKNLLNFKNGEAILRPEFGIGKIYEMLYTPFDKYTTQKMIKTLRTVISDYESRVEIISIPTTYSEKDQEFCFTINYYVPSLNQNDSIQYYLKK